MIKCEVCGEEFSSDGGLHRHIKKHGLTMAEYYTKFYPRNNLLTGDPLAFKNKDQYFNQDFSTRQQLLKWCQTESGDKVTPYIKKLLSKRICSKDLKLAPSHIELRLSSLPTIDIYRQHFGSYTEACKQAGATLMFGSHAPEEFHKPLGRDVKIFIDTREQQPLSFADSESMKLDFGDYAVGGEDYAYTYVDRKGEQDFKSTLSKNNLERFRNELASAREFNSYMYIVVESDLNQIYKRNRWGPHQSNLRYIYHNMRVFAHEFAGHCQFLFTGSRENSQKLIPKLLVMGDKLWDVDLQYYIDRDGVG
jgi:hypothetical protein